MEKSDACASIDSKASAVQQQDIGRGHSQLLTGISTEDLGSNNNGITGAQLGDSTEQQRALQFTGCGTNGRPGDTNNAAQTHHMSAHAMQHVQQQQYTQQQQHTQQLRQQHTQQRHEQPPQQHTPQQHTPQQHAPQQHTPQQHTQQQQTQQQQYTQQPQHHVQQQRLQHESSGAPHHSHPGPASNAMHAAHHHLRNTGANIVTGPHRNNSTLGQPAATTVKRLKNDYNQHFIDTGERPQNFVRDSEPTERFGEYPKLGQLIKFKDDLNARRSHPPQHIRADLRTLDMAGALGMRFDVILVDPPWLEYQQRAVGGFASQEDLSPWTLEDLKSLKVKTVAESPSFCFIWAGETHLEDARILLKEWGYRRCEDVSWIKSNSRQSRRRRLGQMGGRGLIHDDTSFLQRTKEHCLMGINGGVRRSTDTHLIHANVDTDVILEEEPEDVGSTAKPIELYDIIERFCLGRRKLELFGRDRNIRRGWVTVGRDISVSNWDRAKYSSWTSNPMEGTEHGGPLPEPDYWGHPKIQDYRGGRYVGRMPEIEMLRPKSPPRKGGGTSSSLSTASSGNMQQQQINSGTAYPMGKSLYSNAR